jgi:hypothetical protein
VARGRADGGGLNGQVGDGGSDGQEGRTGSGERCGVGRSSGRGAQGHGGEGAWGCTWLGWPVRPLSLGDGQGAAIHHLDQPGTVQSSQATARVCIPCVID